MKKGFTLIELLAVIVILAVIALIATPIILGIIDDTKKSAFKDSAYGISQAAKNAFVEIMYAGSDPKDITYTYTDGIETSDPNGYVLNYEGDKPKNGQVKLTKEGKVSLYLHDGKYCVTKGFDEVEITIEEIEEVYCTPPVIVDQSGANAPVLAQGMTAVIWDGSNWIPASNIDNIYRQNWYDYEEKKWANARTNDGSMWVWIPRYAYQVASGYHTNTVGTINVKFLQGTTDTTNDSTVVALNPTYSGSSQTNYIKHLAFNFGGMELTGIWVAKYEMSGTTASLDVKPGIASLREVTPGNMFTASRNMETNNKYGWALASGLNANGTFTTNTNNIDTHMMKNIEWGAVAYLTQSIYGKNAEVTINADSNFYTGGGSGNAYVSNVGQSTTGTIYGIYDMSGGGYEYIAAYVNNGNSSLNNGSAIISADNKYKDIYTQGSSDTAALNYSATSSKKGDAVWEISNSSSGSSSWYNDDSIMVSTSNPWFVRGGHNAAGTGAGIYFFVSGMGGAGANGAWHVILLVGTGL